MGTVDWSPAHDRSNTYLSRDRRLAPSWFQHNCAKSAVAILQLTKKIGTYIWDLYTEFLHKINYRKPTADHVYQKSMIFEETISLKGNAWQKASHFCMLCLICTSCICDALLVLVRELLKRSCIQATRPVHSYIF